MDEQKKYRPVIGEDKDYHIVEPSGGVYKALKLLMLESVGTGISEKISIAKEFKLIKDLKDKEELEKFQKGLNEKEFGIPVFFERVFDVLFIEKNKEVKFDNLNLNQVNKAMNDFFMLASGS